MEFFSIRLLVSDFSAAIHFWRDVMKLTVSYTDEVGYAYFNLGNIGLELMKRDNLVTALGEATPADKPTGRQITLNFKVDDVDAAFADLVSRGATAIAKPQDRPDWNARTAHLTDPDGNIIELYKPLSPSNP
jgi:predicted enzyme related to lactoylglutathione lyase